MESYIIIYIPKMDAGHSVSLRIMHSDITVDFILIISLQFAYHTKLRITHSITFAWNAALTRRER